MEQVMFEEQLHVFLENTKKGIEVSESEKDAFLKLVENPKEEMDVFTYCKIMYIAGMQYEKEENKNAARYCAMRILWMVECLSKKRKKAPMYLIMEDFTMEEDMKNFMDRYTDFLEDIYADINQKVFLLTAGLFAIVFLILVLFLHIEILMAFIGAFLLALFNYYFEKRRIPDMFQKNQLKAIETYVDKQLLDFDLPYRR